ncbi:MULTISPECIES: type I pullulanase [unclassified Streptococcus]|uniref:type I pullulanase n=2 Tax=Bacteria TaxID=2 RepID=UPI001072E9C0|nr:MULTISPECIES: type I pullulanase [unclassified Streptococcus]MBF0787531.1 type I pullulanase [Streptococcus sp. 19428wC2_LYSM12]MCQ9211444.1 type I pullulanase [Streptococcus sp. B01]MCQ9214759.1 type I pullulanase [Streptococcus sp. O1]TFV05482.1 type I pullulanase [Streptococcus sp. LYSM12]
MALRQFKAYLDDETSIRVLLEKRFDHPDMIFTITSELGEEKLLLQNRIEQEQTIIYHLSSLHQLNVTSDYIIYDQDRNTSELAYGHIVRSRLFEQTFTYDGQDLGSHYTPTETQFKLWAPISKAVFLILDGTPYTMKKQEKGVWQVAVAGDLDGASYHYLHKVNGQWISVHDPYALSSKANAGDSYVINLAKLSIPRRARTQLPPAQAIIYEMSVRDFSQQADAGFKHAGQFLGLTESPQQKEMKLGIDYIKELGVTHIQLMPLYDFGSVDENYPQAVYNWGYDPVQYNVPEGSFASQPDDPYVRICELQTAIQTYHDANISVIMDVVYNHVYHAEEYAFERIVPGYFYRYQENGLRTDGTFCGNDVASERSMVRNYIKQSLRQWTKLYGFDGFRFDLMGILDVETMNQIEAELSALHDNIYLYGEGWKMATALDFDELAHQYNAEKLPTFGFFNDDYRDTIKKVLLDPQSLVEKQLHEKIQHLLTGSRFSHFLSPTQSVNYIECHDNATAFDYFHIENPNWSLHQQKRAASFGLQLILISQGMAFIHSGQEFFRTKDGIDNTYNIPDCINRLDWTRAVRYREHIQFIRDLIAFRKEHPILSQSNYATIQKTCDFYWLTEYVLRYTVISNGEKIQFLINFSNSDFTYEKEANQIVRFTFPPMVDDRHQIIIAGQSMCILESNA